MLIYQISTWNGPTAMLAREFAERKRIDAALSELWRQIHSMIAGDGGLDTKRGWRLHEEFCAYEESLKSEPLALGTYRTKEFYMRPDEHFSTFVGFYQTRR